MEWVIGPKVRCDIVCFAGVNLSGERTVVQIFPYGGRQGNIATGMLKSAAVVAPLGTRVVFSTAPANDPTWEQSPWRAVIIKKGSAIRNSEGDPMVRIPDLDWLDKFDARRADQDLQMAFDFAETLAEGAGWSFGRPGDIKGNILTIRVDKIA